MKRILISAIAALAISSVLFAAKPAVDRENQILLTIDKKPVTLGEFEYLYHKNNSQQLEPQTIDQYIDMFVNYKLKVAEAEAAGLDTTATFRNELRGYATDLAQPYLVDKDVEQKIIDEIYDRMKQEVNVSHIMLFTGNNDIEKNANRHRLDSIRQVIISGNATFEEMASKHSIDRSSNFRGGNMGFITANRYPYTFEEATYNTPVGSISETIETPFGYHIVKPVERRDARGQVLCQHILKLTMDCTPEMKATKRAQIDSIHALLVAGADFDELAVAESDDNSARQGGRLPWFSTGAMVKPFEDAAFSLKDGQISDVVETEYGYHIIKRLDSKGIESKEAATPQIKNAIARDTRGTLARKAKLEEYKTLLNFRVNRPAFAMVESMIKNNGGCDSLIIDNLTKINATLLEFDGNKVRVSDIAHSIAPMDGVPAEAAFKVFESKANAMADNLLTEKAIDLLPETNNEYRNLLNEYRDGILLFEISDKKVWSRSKDDATGLEAWFEANRDKYTWEKPKFKSYVIFATSDSILDIARRFLDTNTVDDRQLSTALRQLCGKEVRVERVIAANGENAIVDYLGFGGKRPEPSGKWISYMAYKPQIIDAPQEAADERGSVTADYQNHLEKNWVKELHKKHKVKINKKVLKMAK